MTKHPEVEVQLSGEDGNIFFIMGRVRKALKQAGHEDSVVEVSKKIMESESYDEALRVVMQFVTVN